MLSTIIIAIFTLILVLVCVSLVLLILMQRPSANAGMGAALGGGAAESMFGGETGNMLTKLTVKLTVVFFVLCAGLYLGYIYVNKGDIDAEERTIDIMKSSAPAETPPPAEAPAAPAETPAPEASAENAAK